ncbi:hypothetical protein [Agromyces silvae]|uniref:hypothetical protein n=1 Tax=Agromyces silvae TaxID=3388266 RepID=UPI0035A07A08
MEDYVALGDAQLLADVVIRSDHVRARTGRGELSSAIALEVFRQGAFLIAHQHMRVPLDWHFITKNAVLRWSRWLPSFPASGEMRYQLDVRVDIETKRGRPFLLMWGLRLLYGGRVVADGELHGWTVAPARYRALRRTALAAPERPARPQTPQGESGAIVEWDDHDPFLLNRPGDHVVSMILIDAVLRAVNAEEIRLRSFEMEFRRFAERTVPVYLLVNTDHAGVSNVTFTQSGEVVAVASTSSEPYAV